MYKERRRRWRLRVAEYTGDPEQVSFSLSSFFDKFNTNIYYFLASSQVFFWDGGALRNKAVPDKVVSVPYGTLGKNVRGKKSSKIKLSKHPHAIQRGRGSIPAHAG